MRQKSKCSKFRLPAVLMRIAVAAAVMVCVADTAGADWTVTQTIELKTGWNAVFLTVQPADPKPDTLFNGLPVDKVVSYFPMSSSVQFIQDPDEIPFNTAGWRYWVSKDQPEHFMNNLHALQANLAYLVHCTADVSWKPSGIPEIRPVSWQPDSYNLTGVHTAPGSSPTFSAYYSGAKAFSDASIYTLQGGIWIQGKANMPLKSGHAYWIYCKGGSDYTAPLDVKLPASGNAMDYDAAFSELEMTITNRSAVPVSFTLTPKAQTDPAAPLSLVNFTPETGNTYTDFTAYTPPSALNPGNSVAIRLAVRRGELAGEVKSLLKLTDTVGGLLFIPVHAVPAGTETFAGLWIGEIEIDKVNEVASKIDPETVKDVENPFDLRILLHSDASGQVRLLRDVTLMQKLEMVEENGQTLEMVRRALITDETLLPQFEGVVRRDGKLAGIRMGATTFDFDPAQNELGLTGAIGPSGSVTGALTLAKTHPANPFRHKFHPDHRNDSDKGIVVTRTITLNFNPVTDSGDPEAGVSTLNGTYRETIEGLHKALIALEGAFTLNRVSTIDKLNE